MSQSLWVNLQVTPYPLLDSRLLGDRGKVGSGKAGVSGSLEGGHVNKMKVGGQGSAVSLETWQRRGRNRKQVGKGFWEFHAMSKTP